MLFFFRSAPEVEKRIHSKLFRKFWRSRGTKEIIRYRCLICLSSNYVISPSVIFEFICIHFISILTHQGCHRQQTTWSGCRIGLRHIKSSNRTNENCETKNFTRAQIQPPKRNSVILYGAHAGCY